MYKFLRPFTAPLSLAAVLALVETLLALAQPWPLKLAVDSAIGDQPLRGWASPLAGLSAPVLGAVAASAAVALVVTTGLTGYFVSYLSGAAAERIGADIRT